MSSGTKTGDLSGPSTVRPDRHRTSPLRQPLSRPRAALPPSPGAPPAPSRSRRAPGAAAVGLRTAPWPAGSKRPGRRVRGEPASRARSPLGTAAGRSSLGRFRPSAPATHTLTPPTRSHTIPEASGARAFCRSGAASRPGPEMAAEQRESGLGRAPVRLAGGRSPARESSAAVALATAAGLGTHCGLGLAGLRPAAHGSGFPRARTPRSRSRAHLARPRRPGLGLGRRCPAWECECLDGREGTCPGHTRVPRSRPRVTAEPPEPNRPPNPQWNSCSFRGTREADGCGRSTRLVPDGLRRCADLALDKPNQMI